MKQLCIIIWALVLAILALITTHTVSASEDSDKLFHLRSEIHSKILQQDRFVIDNQTIDLPPVDYNSSTTNVTNPYDAWKTLPDWIRYLFGCS
jgi:hypothetical protein